MKFLLRVLSQTLKIERGNRRRGGRSERVVLSRKRFGKEKKKELKILLA